jgi:hypothetical protein
MSDLPIHRWPRKRPRKFGPGAAISSFEELDRLISDRMAGIPTFVWVNYGFGDAGRVEDAAYTANRSYLWVRDALRRGGTMLRAEITDEYRAWLAAEMEAAK